MLRKGGHPYSEVPLYLGFRVHYKVILEIWDSDTEKSDDSDDASLQTGDTKMHQLTEITDSSLKTGTGLGLTLKCTGKKHNLLA